MHWWTERKGICLHKVICMKEPPHQKREKTGETGLASPGDACLSSECSRRSCKQMMETLFHRASLLQKQSFWGQVTKHHQGRAFSIFCKVSSCGTFRAPGNMELLWHIQDGCLGITEETAFFAQSSVLSPWTSAAWAWKCTLPKWLKWATDIFEGRWSRRRKKTPWMSLGNGPGQTGLQYNHWGITKITERDLDGNTQGSATWRCEMNSAKCGLPPLVGPQCNPEAREIWGNWRSWY